MRKFSTNQILFELETKNTTKWAPCLNHSDMQEYCQRAMRRDMLGIKRLSTQRICFLVCQNICDRYSHKSMTQNVSQRREEREERQMSTTQEILKLTDAMEWNHYIKNKGILPLKKI